MMLSISPLTSISTSAASGSASNCVYLCKRPPSPSLCYSYTTGGTRSLRYRRRARAASLQTRALFGLGLPELVVIAGVAALVFGPKKLPEIGKSLGKTVKSFQQAAKEFETEVKKENEAIIKDVAEEAGAAAVSETKGKEA